MMNRLTYVSGASGASYSLDSNVVAVGAGASLRSYDWDYDLGRMGISSVVSGARDVTLSLGARKSAADELLTALAVDMELQKPGKLGLDGWQQRCLVPKAETNHVYHGHVTLSLTCVLLDGWWWRESSRYFPRGISSGGIDLPVDHDYDLGHDSGRAVLSNASLLPAPLRITYWGPCVNPYVMLGGNRYQVDVEVRTGSTLVIDAMDAAKTVTLYDSAGNGASAFSGAVRENGAMAFERLPSGDNEVRWSGLFAFQVDWRERRVMPPWVQ